MTNYTIYKLGISVFGEKEKFRRWLNKSNYSLGGLDPIHLMLSVNGKRQVHDCLMRIEYGNLA